MQIANAALSQVLEEGTQRVRSWGLQRKRAGMNRCDMGTFSQTMGSAKENP